MNKSLKIEIDVSMYESIDALKDPSVIDKIVGEINEILQKKGQRANNSSIVKSYKNAVSLLRWKKKQISPGLLTIYLPTNVLEFIQDTVVPNASSDEDVLETSVDKDSIDSELDCQLISPVPDDSHISF
ncbi:unnamed protein product, partial [Rotaria sp. Silwood1]